MLKKLLLILIAASSVMAFSATNAFAYYGGYCGPPVTSKSEMISYLQSPAGRPLARGAEMYVRAHASYYHIQADQGFISWLQMSNVKFFNAPAGYQLTGNTYCPGNTPEPYAGHYSVGGLAMMWWCQDSSGPGYNCVPITKGYCHNWVMGRPVHPKPKAYKPAPKPTKCRKGYHKSHGKCVKPKPAPKPKPTPMQTCNGTIVTINGQSVCQSQSNSNSTSQSGTTSGQGSPVINVNQTTQVNQQQNQGQQQTSNNNVCSDQYASNYNQTGPCTFSQQTPPPAPTCASNQYGTPPNCKTVPTIYVWNDTQESYLGEHLKYYVKVAGDFDSVSVDMQNGRCDNSGSASPDTFNGQNAFSDYCTAPSEGTSTTLTWTVMYNGGQTVTKTITVNLIPNGTPPS